MLVVPLDVTDAASVAAAAARVHQELGPIDLAVLSAGYWKQMDPQDWDTEVFDQHIRVNLTGMSNSIAAVLPGMLRRHHGVIAGIASVAGYRGLAGSEAYGATKAAQINLLESLRVHIARTGVQVTTICPGFVRTDLTAANPFPMPVDSRQAPRRIPPRRPLYPPSAQRDGRNAAIPRRGQSTETDAPMRPHDRNKGLVARF